VKIAVVQHRLRGLASDDAAALMDAAEQAAERGADFVVFPEVPSLDGEDNLDRTMLYLQLGGVAGQRLIPQVREGDVLAGIAMAPEGLESLGTLALMVGDSCFDPEALQYLAQAEPDVAVMIPRAESELQAEAVLEMALALSDSLAGLVIVAEATGGEFGEAGHGGSAIIALGKMVAEAMRDDEIIYADIDTPPAQPTPREPLPEAPEILKQRLAAHRGEHPDVDYLADLS
jgi:predicted amidohydrolase